MRKAKDRYIAFAFNLLIFALLFIGHYSLGGILTVKNATPLLILPMLTAFSMFNDELASALTGLFFGIFMDGASSEVYCFQLEYTFSCCTVYTGKSILLLLEMAYILCF